jgi:hypothetical protein
MPRAGFEPAIPMFERSKTVRALDHAAIGTGSNIIYFANYANSSSKNRDRSVGIVLGYGLDDRGSRVRFPAGAGNFSLRHCFQNGSGAHPASYPMGTRGSFPGGKAART